MRGFQSYLRNCITDLNRKLGYIQSIHLKFPGKTLYQITNFHTQEVINLYGYDFKKNKTSFQFNKNMSDQAFILPK